MSSMSIVLLFVLLNIVFNVVCRPQQISIESDFQLTENEIELIKNPHFLSLLRKFKNQLPSELHSSSSQNEATRQFGNKLQKNSDINQTTEDISQNNDTLERTSQDMSQKYGSIDDDEVTEASENELQRNKIDEVDSEENDDSEVTNDEPQKAQYQFATRVDNNIDGNFQQREETRDGNKITGSYFYDDGNILRSVTYSADEKGFHIIKEEICPSIKALQTRDGKAEVIMYNNGKMIEYNITKDDKDKVEEDEVDENEVEDVVDENEVEEDEVEDE